MGYYATAGGDVFLKRPLTEKEKEIVADLINDWYEVNFYQKNDGFDLCYDGKYYDSAIDCLNQFAEEFPNLISESTIYFNGEDSEQWRFVYKPDTGEFIEQGSTVIYDGDETDHAEFIGQIMDIFEDYLDRHTSVARTQDYELDPPVMLDGINYDELSSQLEELMKNWRVF